MGRVKLAASSTISFQIQKKELERSLCMVANRIRGNPNAVRYVANGGIAGRSMIRVCKRDTSVVGYFYEGLSNQFNTLLALALSQQSEKGVEIFYNIALTPVARLTFDLQVAHIPVAIRNNTSMLRQLFEVDDDTTDKQSGYRNLCAE